MELQNEGKARELADLWVNTTASLLILLRTLKYECWMKAKTEHCLMAFSLLTDGKYTGNLNARRESKKVVRASILHLTW